MSLDDAFDELTLNILPTEEVAYRSQIGEFHVELQEASNISFCFRRVNASLITLEIEED
jgi:hypothetical protein